MAHLDERRVSRFDAQQCWVPGALLLGVLVGLVLPYQAESGSKESPGYSRLSEVLGWTYFCAWSVSFYPQIVLNCARRSVVGLSVEYTVLNLLGFGFYFLFNATLYWDSHVQEEYRQSHGGNQSAVRLNDVFFSGHAMFATAVTLAQIVVYYDYPPLDRCDRFLRVAVLCAVTAVLLGGVGVAVVIWVGREESLSWLQYLSLLSGVKLVISIFKYCPQVWMNVRRRSTEGWNIYNVLLDFSGGLLSVLQELLDCWSQDDWSKLTGDPVKLLLGSFSMVFDVVFMFQHCCCYAQAARVARLGPSEGFRAPCPLLAADTLEQHASSTGPAVSRHRAC